MHRIHPAFLHQSPIFLRNLYNSQGNISINTCTTLATILLRLGKQRLHFFEISNILIQIAYTIYDGNKTKLYSDLSGSFNSPTLSYPYSDLRIVLETNSVSYFGVRWEVVNLPYVPLYCSDEPNFDLATIPDIYLKIFHSASGQFSPGFGAPGYKNNMFCVWFINPILSNFHFLL